MFTVLLCTSFFSVSLGHSLSVFSFRNYYLQSRIYYFVFISSLISLFIVQVTSEGNIFSGQNAEYVVEITGQVLSDSKEIGGGQKMFSFQLLSAEDINSTRTSASGSLIVTSQLDLYKGQFVSLAKKNILIQNSAIIFLDQKNIRILEWGTAWDIMIMEKRAKILAYLKKHIKHMGSGPASLFTALFVGVKENPNGELFTALRRAGGSHILALSGMHLGIISFGIMFVFTGLFGKRISFAVTLIIILFYAFIVSAGPSLTRAVILFILIGLLNLSGRKTDIFHILSICFLIQILLDPDSANTLSFQLSYLALSGIILGSRKIDRILPGIIPGGIRGILSASISAQLFTAPLVLYYFGVIYPVGIISGIVLLPVITLFIWTGIFGLLPMPWILQRIMFSAAASLYKAIEVSADIFSRFPLLEANGAVFIGIILIVLFFVYFTISKNKSNRSRISN